MNLPTIIRGLPEDDYHGHPAFGSTDLKLILNRSPAHFRWRKDHPDVLTPAKRDGRILHCAMLEPHLFHKKYAVLPADAPQDKRRFRNAKDPSADTLASIAWWDEWEALHPGVEIIAADKYEECMRITEAVRTHPDLRGYFEAADGENELSVFARDPETGLPVKARLDRRVRLGGVLMALDAKSIEDCRPHSFQRSAESYGYFLQNAHYLNVCEWAGEPLDGFLFIAFEKEGPYAVRVYEADERAIEDGREQCRKALALAKHCTDTGEWPGPDTSITVIGRPRWAVDANNNGEWA